MNIKDTIVSIITPYGYSSVGIIRISGSLTTLVANKILKKNPKIRIAEYMYFYDLKNKIIDKGIVLFFSKPNSFTGEDILELHGHGNPIILNYILDNICNIKGIRLAKEGEFTERAFLNKKLDLIQAESIADLINANSIQTANLAIKSLSGNFSNKINKLIEKNLNIRTNVEAMIDFSVNENNFLFIKNEISSLLKEIKNYLILSDKSSFLYKGFKFVICGEPNVGKSSIFNILSGNESAIVTDIPGTTRDVLHKYININGNLIDIIDTAGLHKSKDKIESIGIEYAKNEIKNADHLLFVINSIEYKKFNDILLKIKEIIFNKKYIDKSLITIIKNKSDLNNDKIELKILEGYTVISISSKLNLGFKLLFDRIKFIIINNIKNNNKLLINKRNILALKKAYKHILNAKNKYLFISKIEFLAEELKYSEKYLSEITGKVYSDKLLKNIFSKFCIGK